MHNFVSDVPHTLAVAGRRSLLGIFGTSQLWAGIVCVTGRFCIEFWELVSLAGK